MSRQVLQTELIIAGEIYKIEFINLIYKIIIISLLFIALIVIISNITKYIENNYKLMNDLRENLNEHKIITDEMLHTLTEKIVSNYTIIDELKEIINLQGIDMNKLTEKTDSQECISNEMFETLTLTERIISNHVIYTNGLFDSLTEKIVSNRDVTTSITDRINNFELNNNNNNIIIGTYDNNPGDNFGTRRTQMQLYVNILSDNIELSYRYHNLLYMSELLKLKKLKNIKMTGGDGRSDHMHLDASCGITLHVHDPILLNPIDEGMTRSTIALMRQDNFEPFRNEFQTRNDPFWANNSQGFIIIYTNMACLAKILNLKVFHNKIDCTENVYKKVDERYSYKFNFLELYFKEMGYIGYNNN